MIIAIIGIGVAACALTWFAITDFGSSKRTKKNSTLNRIRPSLACAGSCRFMFGSDTAFQRPITAAEVASFTTNG